MAYTTVFKGGWLICPQQPSAAVQGWLVRSFHFPNTIGGCSRVAGPFFSLVPNNHLPRCGPVAKCNPGGQPSTSVQSATAWVQRMGGHLWTSKWRFAVRRTYQTYIYIYIYIPPQPPPHSASCNVCLFVCAHISKCASAPMKNTTSASCSR